MPRNARVNQKILAAAGAMAEATEKQKDVLLRHGLPPDLIERLRSGAAAVATAQNARTESSRRHVTATAAVNEQVKRGRRAVRLLNAILQPRLAKDPDLLAAWRSAKRVPSIAVAGEVTQAPGRGADAA